MKFLNWLFLRLKNKYHEDQEILGHLENIINEYQIIPKKIDLAFIDSICKKHFIDFDMDRTKDLNFGFTEEERARYRNFVIDIINTTASKNYEKTNNIL